MGPLPNLPSGLFVRGQSDPQIDQGAGTEQRACEDSARRQPSAPQADGARRDQTWHHSDCGLEASKTEKINLCGLSHSALVMAALAN